MRHAHGLREHDPVPVRRGLFQAVVELPAVSAVPVGPGGSAGGREGVKERRTVTINPDRRPPPVHRLPSCHGLLDERIRNAMWIYRMFGFIGVVIGEMAAYIELLEDELARRETEG
jgi:hypothetical protein